MRGSKAKRASFLAANSADVIEKNTGAARCSPLDPPISSQRRR